MAGKTTPGFEREYRRLTHEFPPMKIHSRAQAAATENRIEVMGARSDRSAAEHAYIDLLSDLLADWEDEHVEVPDIHGVELIRALLDDHNLRQKDLVGIFATESVASEVLAGRRDLTRKQIEGLARFFNVSPATFFPAALPGTRDARSAVPSILKVSERRAAFRRRTKMGKGRRRPQGSR